MNEKNVVSTKHGMAVASLVFGILSLFCFFYVGAFVCWGCGIVGCLLSRSAKKAGNGERVTTVGFVVSIIGILLGIVLYFWSLSVGGVL